MRQLTSFLNCSRLPCHRRAPLSPVFPSGPRPSSEAAASRLSEAAASRLSEAAASSPLARWRRLLGTRLRSFLRDRVPLRKPLLPSLGSRRFPSFGSRCFLSSRPLAEAPRDPPLGSSRATSLGSQPSFGRLQDRVPSSRHACLFGDSGATPRPRRLPLMACFRRTLARLVSLLFSATVRFLLGLN
jgi:hypothetical protein